MNKSLKKFLSITMFALAITMLYNTKSFAAEGQYSDNVIPAMSSNTSNAGIVKASSIHSYTYDSWKAFNHSVSGRPNGWASAEGVTTGWLEYDFTNTKCITKYTITSRNPCYRSELPKNWTFEAWDETLNDWVILDKQENIQSWAVGIAKEFVFRNNTSYNKYRINISANNGLSNYVAIGELEMMETIAPTNLKVIADKKCAQLSWDKVVNAESYIIKRSTTPGGNYTTVATGSSISFTDKDLKPGTYYYVVSAAISGTESANSNEVSVTIGEPTPSPTTLKVILEIKEQLQLSVDDDLAENTQMNWTSSDNNVATVDTNGVVTALKPGNIVVTVVSKDGTYTDKINVFIVDDADDYRLAVDLKVGKSSRLTVDDLTDTIKVTWTSMDPTVATISNKGKVTAVSKGLALVTASDGKGNIIGQIYIRVRD